MGLGRKTAPSIRFPLLTCVDGRETTELTIDIRIDLRNALSPVGGRGRMGERLLHEAEVLARTLGDQHRLARVATFMVIQCLATGDYDEAVRFGREALTIARTLGDRSIEVVATSFVGHTHIARGEFSDAATFLERNVALEGDLRSERFGSPAIQSAYSGGPAHRCALRARPVRGGHRARRGCRAYR
jgi:hypothetical protein